MNGEEPFKIQRTQKAAPLISGVPPRFDRGNAALSGSCLCSLATLRENKGTRTDVLRAPLSAALGLMKIGVVSNLLTFSDEAMKLKPEERFTLVEGLIKSLDEPDKSLDEIWAEEAEKRLKAYREGKLEGIPLDEIFKNQ